MAKRSVMIVGGGLAGMAAAMKLAELECDVSIMSLLALRRAHSVCAQGGINSVNNLSRQLGDNESKHFEDTVYGGDFLQHQPPVKEMADWAPRIIDLMDRLGVTFNRTPEGFRDQRRFGGTLYQRTAFAGATTGQQLLYALDEQIRRWEVAGKVQKYENWDFLGPILDEQGRCRGCVAQDTITMRIRAIPADALIMATGGCGLLFGRSTNSMACTGSAASRAFQAGVFYANGEFIQIHPTAIPGADKLRLISESARGEGGRIWVPRKPQDPRPPQTIPESERYYFLEERYPKYGNLLPRDIAVREIFKVCIEEGLSVQSDRMCVYLDVTQLPRDVLDRKLGGIMEIYEKFQGVNPAAVPMKIFPAVHYSMGGLWCDYEANDAGGLRVASPRNQQTNVPGIFAIGECDYQFHGANRLGANSLVACIFSGLTVAPGVVNYIDNLPGGHADDQPASLYDRAAAKHLSQYKALLARPAGGPNPYRLHADLGRLMTRIATVVRHNADLDAGYESLCEMEQQSRLCSLADHSDWANQDVVFLRALQDMFPLAKTIVRGEPVRDECRGAHYKPEFAMPDIEAADPAERRRQAEAWCRQFEENNRRWLKTTLAALDSDGQPQLSFQDVDTRLIKPRPRLYGMVGGDEIERTWKDISMANVIATGTRFRVRVLRQDLPGRKGYWHTFELEYEPDMNCISVLQHIAEKPTTIDGKQVAPVVWECNCLEEVCGSCTMLVNGRVRQACTALVAQLLGDRPGEIELRPMTKFPVIRDLMVDRSRMFAILEKIRAWLPVDSYYDLGPGPRQSQETQYAAYLYSKCMTCGCCLEACPQFLKVELPCEEGETSEQYNARLRAANMRAFIGAFAIGQIELFNSNPVGAMNAGERLDALTAQGGIQVCGNAQNCVKVCPKGIPLTTAIGHAGREATIHVLKKWFDR